jgi:hypothetical protein
LGAAGILAGAIFRVLRPTPGVTSTASGNMICLMALEQRNWEGLVDLVVQVPPMDLQSFLCLTWILEFLTLTLTFRSYLQNLDTEVDINSAWETSRENIKISAKKSLGYYELKKHKPMNSSPHSPNRQSKGVCVDTGPTICLSDSSNLY